MQAALTVVLDVGKTLTKLSLWSPSGALLARESRPNRRIDAGRYAALDAEGVEAWAAGVLSDFARRGRIARIVPVGHGAAFAVLRRGALACPPPDYEAAPPQEIVAAYEAERDAFASTGSPRLPDGLNLGVQLAWLEALHPELLDEDAVIVTWPQYWAWVFSGVAASEVTSLGCHSDLWRPLEGAASDLARRRGWAARLAPLRRAGEVLGTLRPSWAERTGLSPQTQVVCGLHDSNAALLAARGCAEIAGQEATVLSTGTWFVGLRSPGLGAAVDLAALPEGRDCLVNVDAYGAPIPSARFMGGREAELLCGTEVLRIDIGPDQPRLVAAAAEVVRAGTRVLPTLTPGAGPFPNGRGRWVSPPADPDQRRAATGLYLAMTAHAALGLIGARERIVVEGRFAGAEVFVRALAALRPSEAIYVAGAEHDASYGALRLLPGQQLSPSSLMQVRPLEVDIGGYAQQWARDAGRIEAAA